MTSTNRNRAQFADYRDWQWCKHLPLRKYVKPWSVILGSISREIFVVDACAGAGTYTDPTTGDTIAEGSPVIFARQAKAYTEERGPGKSMRVICCERDRDNYVSLVKTLRPFTPHVVTRSGAFRRHVEWIVQTIGDSPLLLLLDPIGLKTITASDWQPLLDRRGKTDLFIVLHFAVVHRIGGMLLPDGTANPAIHVAKRNAAMLDGVFRGPEWRAVAIDPALDGPDHREEREERYVDLYFRDVIGSRHRWKCKFGVRAGYTAPVKYWLVHAGDDRKPYMLMNDLFVELNEILYEREFALPGEIEGFTEAAIAAERDRVQRDLEVAVIERVRAAGGALPFASIRDQLTNQFFGLVKQGAYSRAVKSMCKAERLTRPERLAAALGEDEMIRLPSPPPEHREDVAPIRNVA